jgi:hypothetical protein
VREVGRYGGVREGESVWGREGGMYTDGRLERNSGEREGWRERYRKGGREEERESDADRTLCLDRDLCVDLLV